MPTSAFTWVMSVISFIVFPTMLYFVFRRKLYRQLKFFTIYLILLLIWNIVLSIVSPTPYFFTHAWFVIYFATEFALSCLRLCIIAEISKRALAGYPAVWTLAARLLAGVTVIFLAWTTQSAIMNQHHVRRFVFVGYQRFEFLQAVLLLLILFIGVYYRIQIPSLYRLILAGIGFYASLAVLDQQIGLSEKFVAFDHIKRTSFAILLFMWTYALWRWSPLPDSKPQLISQSTYDEVAPQIHDRLKELNDKLSDLIGKRGR
jgi:hypothetical protein